jgi:pyruvate/2-oxoglutarate dehydrogenase complex dihydrolipoamide dehydrogenase (E3) component
MEDLMHDTPASFDAIIIGAGQAGPSLAVRFAETGLRVALVEREQLGGTCVNTGCMPTKALVASAYAAHLARRSGDFGVRTGGEVTVDFPAVIQRARTVTANARHGLETWIGATPNITLFRGHARFASRNSVRVEDALLSAPRIFLNTGARPLVPALPGIEGVPYLTNEDMLALEVLPRHLIVVGGSYIGLEFAQMYRRFGSDVTVVERMDRLVPREDADISASVRDTLEAEGIVVRTGAECIRLMMHAGQPAVSLDCETGAPEIVGTHILLAVGRRPNTDDLDLANAGLVPDAYGYIPVDDELRTEVPGIWAMGDCNGRGAFTHTAYNDFEIVAANLLDGENRRASDRIAAYGLFIDPPLGRVGMSEMQARASGRRILAGTRPMSRVGRAVEKGETRGLMKIVGDADTREILGAAIHGTGGDEAIHAVLQAMNAGMTLDELRWAVPIHPTVSELVPTLILSMQPVAEPLQSDEPTLAAA